MNQSSTPEDIDALLKERYALKADRDRLRELLQECQLRLDGEDESDELYIRINEELGRD